MTDQPEVIVEIDGQTTIEDVIEGGDNGLHEEAVQV